MHARIGVRERWAREPTRVVVCASANMVLLSKSLSCGGRGTSLREVLTQVLIQRETEITKLEGGKAIA